MKTKVSAILLILVLVMTSVFSSCGNEKEENIITYTETETTKKADELFESKSDEELIELCQKMTEEGNDIQIRDNFFMYLLAKTTAIDEENTEDLYSTALNVMERCLKLPISSPTVVLGFRKNSKSIDGKLTEKTKEFLKGQWIRKDNTALSGMIIDVVEDTEEGLIAKITDLANGKSLNFKTNDVKWKNINFANHKKFYLSDYASEKTVTTDENGQTTIKKMHNTYKGAVARIDFEKHTIKITYTMKSDVTSGAYQTWIKVGYEPEEDTEAEEVETKVENANTSDAPSGKTKKGFFEP